MNLWYTKVQHFHLIPLKHHDPKNLAYRTMQISSEYVKSAVENLSKLPGIGPRSALRLALHILQSENGYADELSKALKELKSKTHRCVKCNNISDHEECSICSNPIRRQNQMCVVENIRDLMAIEETQQFNGLYHVLGGVISPIDGIGPDELFLHSLKERVKTLEVTEIVMALSPSIDGDTTIFYIDKMLQQTGVKISTIARGVSFGGALEYTDGITLGRSILSRVPYNQ